jgi:tripartite-type tricarboxylate transporter receptor subunit TctC
LNIGGCALACAAAFGVSAQGTDYPRKPIRILVGFPPGGNADASARLIGARMSEGLGVNIVIENRGGAGGTIAAQLASRAAADGYSLLWSSPGALTINRILGGNLPYDVDKDFTAVGRTFTFANALIVRSDSPHKNLGQYLAYAREKPGQLQFGTQGVGSAGYLSAQMLQNFANIKMTHIPYKGGALLAAAVASGEAASGFVSTLSATIMRERVRILAVTTAQRDPSLPDVPTMRESGVKDYDATFWFGILVPAGTPAAIVTRLSKEMRAAVADKEVARLAISQGLIPSPSTPQEFTANIRSDYEKWKKVLRKP